MRYAPITTAGQPCASADVFVPACFNSEKSIDTGMRTILNASVFSDGRHPASW